MIVAVVIKQIIISFLLMLLGVICYKTKMITTDVSKALSDFVLTIVSPAVILNACQIQFSQEFAKNLLASFGLSALSYGIAIALAQILVSKRNREYAIERFSIVYSNCGFIGIPLVNAIFGEEGVLYLSCYLILFNILLWTHGVFCMSGQKGENLLATICRCPAIIAAVIGLISFGCKLQYPELIKTTITDIANLNTPLAMVVAGVSIMEADIGKALKQKRVYVVTVLKLIVVPLVVLLATLPFPVADTVRMTVVLATCCPVGATGIMFALCYGKNERYASELFAVTTVVSMLTIPVLIYICTLL